MSKYLTPQQIEAMASTALTTFEVCCDWDDATRAAAEYCIDEYGFIPRRSAVLLARKQAQLRWYAIKEATRKAIREGA